MKSTRHAIIAAALLMALAITGASAKGKMVPKVYMYGFSASFNDSIAYFTDVVEVDSAWMDTKTDFLLGRDSYSQQLKSYLSQTMGQPNRTCIVMFGTKRSKVEEDYTKMKKLYTEKAKNQYDVRNIASTDFTFSPVNMSEVEMDEEQTEQPKEEKQKPRPGDRPKPGDSPEPGQGAPMPRM